MQVVRIMAEELGWTAAEQRTQLEKARTFIDLEMGQEARQQVSIDRLIALVDMIVAISTPSCYSR